MVVYYGWVNILNSMDEYDFPRLLQTVGDVEGMVDEIGYSGRILELKWMNGQCILCTAGASNHRTQDVTDIISLFERVSSIAPGSYGILYVYDDEAQQGTSDEFEVFKVAQGRFTVEEDHQFSPLSAKVFGRPLS